MDARLVVVLDDFRGSCPGDPGPPVDRGQQDQHAGQQNIFKTLQTELSNFSQQPEMDPRCLPVQRAGTMQFLAEYRGRAGQ